MPDLEVPRGDAPVAHLATPQWQSFEVRMRARKADRCLQRAAAALDDGSIDEASDALEEARQLSSLDPRLEGLSARLDALKQPPLPPAAQGPGYFWRSAAIAAGLVVVSAAGWGGWVYKDQIVQIVPKAQPDMDASTGLAAPTAANDNATAPSTLSGSEDAGAGAKSNDTVVQTTLVRPDEVIDTRTPPSSAEPANPLLSDATTGSDQRIDSKPEAVKALATPTAPELPTRSQRDAPLPASPEYPAPAVLPATPNPSPATTFIPSVVPSTEPPRAANAPTTASATNPSTNAGGTSPAAAAPPPPSPAPAASTPAAESAAAPDERIAIRAALSRYESAYNRLDVDAARLIWPSLDQRALARAFDNLTSQRVALQNCNVDVSGSTARANCSGNASWTPKVGGGERSSARKWTFDLSEANGAWRITHVQAR